MTASGPGLVTAVRRMTSVLGAGFGATVGTQMGDPVSGAMAGEALAQLGEDFIERVLSPRQEERVATVLSLATDLISEGLAEGATLRDDGFFDEPHTDASEIFEGILLTARDEHEAKKLPYVARMMSAIAFDENLTVPTANFLVVETDRLTWLQMSLLAIVSRPEEFPLPEVEIGEFGTTWGDWTISRTFHRMMAPEGTLLQSPRQKDPRTGFPGYDLRLSQLQLTNQGQLMASALGLDSVPVDELTDVYNTVVEVAELRHQQLGDN